MFGLVDHRIVLELFLFLGRVGLYLFQLVLYS